MDCGNVRNEKSIFYFLKQKIYDIIFLQETHFCLNVEKLWQWEWGGTLFFLHGENNLIVKELLF